MKDRRMKDAITLKEQREALGYNSSGVSAADMRTRLTNLKLLIDRRFEIFAEADDDQVCQVCVEFQEKIQDILDTLNPVESTGTPRKLSLASRSSSPAVSAVRRHDTVVLQGSLSEGENSSGKSVVADGLFTAARSVDKVAVKVKMFEAEHAVRAEHEYNMMARLHHADGNRFVRPYAFLEGAQGQIIPQGPEDAVYCATAVCIVMEKGTINMLDFFEKYKDIDRTEKLATIATMLDILTSAAQAKIVLNDFKPANIVYVSDGCYQRWKAIDFENSRGEGEEMPAETTAAYCSPEVAIEILARSRGEVPKPLTASQKMDIMALGWSVYEIANNMISFWKNQDPPLLENGDILTALACLKDEDVEKDIERTFVGQQYGPFRTWLLHALKANHKERATALELRHGHSLFGSKDRTIDEKSILSQLNKGVERILEDNKKNTTIILERIDELSDQLESSLSVLGASLDCVAAQVALGSERQKEDIASLFNAVNQQKELLSQGVTLDEKALQAAVVSAMSNMEESLTARISSSVGDMIASVGPSANEKLDVLLEMVSGLQAQSDRLAEEFKLFKTLSESQCKMLAILEKTGNRMPLTFVILPGIDDSEKLPNTASMMGKMVNCAKRKSKSLTKLVWDNSRIVFICPVTHQQVCVGDILRDKHCHDVTVHNWW